MERSINVRSQTFQGSSMAASVKQIAEELGVSFQLVSAVLAGKSYCRASEETKRKIFATAEKLGYQPNMNARVLTGKPSRVLGLIADLHAASPSNRVLAELEREATRADFRLMIGGFHDRVEDIISSYRLLQQHRVDGIFLLSLDDLRYRKQLTDFLQGEKNLVVIRAPMMKQHFGVATSLSSMFAEIVTELQEAGRRNIHYMGTYPVSHQAMKERIRGFSKAFDDAEDRVHRLSSSGGILEADGMSPDDFIEKVVKPRKIDALVMQDDLSALHWIDLLQKHHLTVPDDVAVTGCNNDPFARYAAPSIASVDFREKQIAQAAMKLMLRSLRGEAPEIVRIRLEFIRRKSFSRSISTVIQSDGGPQS